MPGDMNPAADNDNIGEVKISADVITVIAHTVANEVEGVASMNAKIADNISSVLGRKSPTKGVKVEIDDKKDVTIDFYIVVDYGARIPDVAWRIQEQVKSAVESMTGMNVAAINIHVEGVSFEKDKEEQKSDEPSK
ncbi:MAG TPA: Asp23/Gls24 family envelope stress response protein [Ruminiclostridium sp.]|nr:Asp23/Gls24 family envelope stress response protein [Ruminiclostridium sp.]